MMAKRHEREKLGDIEPTVGWQRLVQHLETKSISDFAAEIGVKPPSVFSWIWLDKRVSQVHLPAVTKAADAKLEDWWVPIRSTAALASINRMKAKRKKKAAA